MLAFNCHYTDYNHVGAFTFTSAGSSPVTITILFTILRPRALAPCAFQAVVLGLAEQLEIVDQGVVVMPISVVRDDVIGIRRP